jgi:hypothetical protein
LASISSTKEVYSHNYEIKNVFEDLTSKNYKSKILSNKFSSKKADESKACSVWCKGLFFVALLNICISVEVYANKYSKMYEDRWNSEHLNGVSVNLTYNVSEDISQKNMSYA